MKRFYKAVTTASDDGGWRVLLDGRGIKTAGGRAQIVPTQALAEAMAQEWAEQGEELDLDQFRLRDLADFAIDAVQPARDDVISSLVPYAETDTLCYRADPEDALFRRQQEVWEPILAGAEARWGVRFTRVSGIVHKPQPDATLGALRDALAAEGDFSLAALKMLSSLAASLVIALTSVQADADGEVLWRAANLEEDWQVELWGHDEEADARRAARLEAFMLAIRFAQLARTE